jgi:hypothetical protein
MDGAGRSTIVRVVAVAVTGVVAVAAIAGSVGLLSARDYLGERMRLPLGNLYTASVALLVLVAVPMAVASLATVLATRHHPLIVLAAGLLVLAWILIELTLIKVYTWHLPFYLVAALAVLGLAWLLRRQQPPVQ